MIANRKEFAVGVFMMAGFWAMFAVLMSPVFGGKNALDYLDNLYNSISKASAYYIPKERQAIEPLKGKEINATVKAESPLQAMRIQALLGASGASVEVSGDRLTVRGDLAAILDNALVDSDAMFSNNGSQLAEKYGADHRQVLYDWWGFNKGLEKALQKQKEFKAASAVYSAQTKGVEPAYNYFGIEAQAIKDKLSIVVLSLAGYVVYTLWFGFSIFFLFEGWGLRIEH